MNPEQLAKAGTEHAHQTAIFCWRNMAVHYGFAVANDMAHYGFARVPPKEPALPALATLYAIKNAGHGDAVRGARNKAEGVTVGIPDICLPIRMGVYNALYIELKRPGKNSMSQQQREMHALLMAEKNMVVVCVGWQAACKTIQAYYERSRI
jgi:hypothetical protein